MAIKELKEELLKMLKSDMIGMKKDSKKDLFDGIMPEKGSIKKVTVISDSKEGLKKGLSKAQKEIMKAKLGIDPEEKEDEKECPKCDKMPCECD